MASVEAHLELEKCKVELESTRKQLARSERQVEKLTNSNEDLRKQVESLSSELHKFRNIKRTDVEIQIDKEDLLNYVSGAIVLPDWGKTAPEVVSGSGVSNDSNQQTAVSSEQTEAGAALSIAEGLKATAEAALQQTGFVFDDNSGLYYDFNSGYYYDSEKSLYYDPNTGTYFYYNHETNEYQFHSQVDVSCYSWQQNANYGQEAAPTQQGQTTADHRQSNTSLAESKAKNHKEKKKKEKKKERLKTEKGYKNRKQRRQEMRERQLRKEKKEKRKKEKKDKELSGSRKNRKYEEKKYKKDKEKQRNRTVDQSDEKSDGKVLKTSDENDLVDVSNVLVIDIRSTAGDEIETCKKTSLDEKGIEISEHENADSIHQSVDLAVKCSACVNKQNIPSSNEGQVDAKMFDKPCNSCSLSSKNSVLCKCNTLKPIENGINLEIITHDKTEADMDIEVSHNSRGQEQISTDMLDCSSDLPRKEVICIDEPDSESLTDTHISSCDQKELDKKFAKNDGSTEIGGISETGVILVSSDSEFESEMESGELTDSDSDSDSSVSESSSPSDSDSEEEMEVLEEELATSWPPCIRAIVWESDCLEVGSLFIVTYTGGTIGREGDDGHVISVPDINVSKNHAKIQFSEEQGEYLITDQGSQNGTFVNDHRIGQSKEKGQPVLLRHGDVIQLGGTKILCHIHSGSDTCDACEPGIVMAEYHAKHQAPKEIQILSKEEKIKLQKQQLKEIKQKYGLKNAAYVNNVDAIKNPNYEDKAAIRRQTKGSDNPHQKTEAPASVYRPISSGNIGHQLLKKMGWSEGESLGKDNTGIQEPVMVTVRTSLTAGLGSNLAGACSVDSVQTVDMRKAQRRVQAQKRFQQVSGGVGGGGDRSADKSVSKPMTWTKGETQFSDCSLGTAPNPSETVKRQ